MLEKNKIEGAVDAVLTLMKAKDDIGLVDLPKKIDLQFNIKRIPKIKHKNIPVELPTSIHYDLREVCIFVKDLNKKNREYDATVQHYEDLFRKHKIDSINKIVPIKALRTDYSLPSSKVQLAKAYDLYLGDSSVMGLLPGILGKIFYAKKKTVPVKVDLDAKDLKTVVEKAVNNTRCTLQGTGSSCLVTVAHDKMEKEQIVGNVEAACKQLMEQVPGGKSNIRNMYIKSTDTASVPIYLDTESANKVKLPAVKENKVAEFVDEITTVEGGKVMVRGDGQVIVLKDKKNKQGGKEKPKKTQGKPEGSENVEGSQEGLKVAQVAAEIMEDKNEELDAAEGKDIDENDVEVHDSDNSEDDDVEKDDNVQTKRSKKVVAKSGKRQQKRKSLEGNDEVTVEKKKQKWTEVATKRESDKKLNKRSRKARKT